MRLTTSTIFALSFSTGAMTTIERPRYTAVQSPQKRSRPMVASTAECPLTRGKGEIPARALNGRDADDRVAVLSGDGDVEPGAQRGRGDRAERRRRTGRRIHERQIERSRTTHAAKG